MVEFDQFRNDAGTNAFVLPPQVWIERTGADAVRNHRCFDFSSLDKSNIPDILAKI